MSEEWISKTELAAWHLAGHGVAAWCYGIDVKSLTLDDTLPSMMRTQIAPMVDAYNPTMPKTVSTIAQVERHVVVRLAGVIGELLRTQKEHAARYGLASPQRLSRNWMMKLRECREPDLDTAFAMTFAWLSGKTDPEQTLISLWGRTELLLRETKNRERLATLANRLSKVRQMSGEEIQALFG